MVPSASIVVSNELVRAAYTLSLNEKRLVMFAVSKLDSSRPNHRVTLESLEYLRFYKIPEKGSGRRDIKKSLDRLWNRVLILSDGLERRWIVTRGKYTGTNIIIEFHHDLTEHLFDLQKHFTKYTLERAADFKLFYTWRIFELVMQFRKTGVLKISVDEFKKILELPDYYNNDFSRVNNKVIRPALKEIKEKDGLEIGYTTTKKGRKITGLEFTFPPEQQKALPLNQPKKTPAAGKGKTSIDEQINQYVTANPMTTRGKSREEIIKLLQEERRRKKAA